MKLLQFFKVSTLYCPDSFFKGSLIRADLSNTWRFNVLLEQIFSLAIAALFIRAIYLTNSYDGVEIAVLIFGILPFGLFIFLQTFSSSLKIWRLVDKGAFAKGYPKKIK